VLFRSANVSPADPHKRTLKSKINIPYLPVNPRLVMSPEKTNKLHVGATGFLGNVTYVFLNLLIEVPIQTFLAPQL
jgi:hypothetical protein